ncbi:hypothetical protein O181_087302 [Austropuccinia psidii MF-1]|uniref:Integrase catalytic domain-containing protein n=1 Tax=Austropuccinia psidii MF-1 TaxID=1389203 RepID=A0A9Q3IPE6_9BASI|nr:hypothetical protein [Austropuccinia psidii MF-1]
MEYSHTRDRCENENRSTSKKFGLMIHIQDPKSLWEVAHMDLVTELPPSGDRSYNYCLLIVDRYSKTPTFLPCHKADTGMDTALLLCNLFISHTGLFKNIINDRDTKFPYALWTNIHKLLGTFTTMGETPPDWCSWKDTPPPGYVSFIHLLVLLSVLL